MISKEVYTKEYISKLRVGSKCDPTLLERAIFAFGLLEALVLSGIEFIFKGGTSLMLLMDNPMRLSTDIDIIVKPGTDMTSYITKASKIYPFIRYEENIRQGANKIVKKHYRFYYQSINSISKEVPILLDVLFENNHYAEVVRKEIKNKLLLCEGDSVLVTLPTINSILGDKLTAFAPHTIGISPVYTKADGTIIDKKIEVIKQFFDIAALSDYADNIDLITETYIATANSELAYRGLSVSWKDCLLDTYNESLSILSRGALNPDYYKDYYLPGIRGLSQYLINVRFTPETAYIQAAKIMYISALILNNSDFENAFPEADLFSDNYSKINYIRKIDKQTFNMIAYAIRLLN